MSVYKRITHVNNNYDETKKFHTALCEKEIELSLLDEKGEMIALGNAVVGNCDRGATNVSNSPIAILGDRKIIRISPYFTVDWFSSQLEREILQPKSKYYTVGVKIPKEDLPRVASAKLEVKPAEGE